MFRPAAADRIMRDPAVPPPDPPRPRPGDSILDVLHSRTGVRPRVQLREESTPPAPVQVPRTREASGVGPRAGKYHVQVEIARGGVGTVYRGTDSDLGREVAIKFLHEKYRDDPDLLQRFVEEAQIGGQLQHPGIVPVYDLGLADEKPYFSMKLVKGRTLAAVLSERGERDPGRARLLALFLQVCQTMAYAHARGVVHRDLKPANVMMGAFGEVQVVDWGMGKVLHAPGSGDAKRARTPAPAVSIIATVRSGEDGTKSLVGSVMGTPAYMPPEQALGEVDSMDERSDVFALGSMLCEILTGQPAYVGEPVEVIRKAARGDLDDAHQRLQQCGAAEALVALARACLSPAPRDRPAHAGEVAARLEKHLAAVEQDLQETRVRARAAKRTQKLVIAVSAIIAGALGVSLVFWSSAERQRERAEQAAAQAQAAEAGERSARQVADQRADEARQAQELERAARTEADSKARDLRRALDDYDLLANVVKLREAIAAEAELYPAWPERAAAMRDWLEQRARPLAASLPSLAATLGQLRQRALPETAPEAAGGSAAAPRFAEKSEQFLYDTLARLVDDLRAFAAGPLASVEARLTWAEAVRGETVAKYAREWAAAADDVARDPRYRGLNLVPQLDLVPLRRDPGSGLWEFVHLRSGTPGKAIPQRNPDTRQLEVTEDSGIVFVLVPPGSFLMGAQADDPAAPNFDPGATPQEKPGPAVELAAFFLAKHEMTKSQWKRLSEGGEPSTYKPGSKPGRVREILATNPVENVSWQDCTDLLARHGLVLPTEAQWEYACRAGSGTPWSTGSTAASLRGHANLADLTSQRAGSAWPIEPEFDDGHVVHAPVGSFAPNGFGLFDMHGNVWEWCQDGSGTYDVARRPGDGLRLEANAERRVSRGGSFAFPAADARSAYRFFDSPGTTDANLGLRPARPVHGP